MAQLPPFRSRDEARAAVQAALRHREIRDDVWETLEHGGFVCEVLGSGGEAEYYATAFKNLQVEEAWLNRQFPAVGSGTMVREPAKPPPVFHRLTLSPAERQRAALAASAMAEEARRHPKFAEFYHRWGAEFSGVTTLDEFLNQATDQCVAEFIAAAAEIGRSLAWGMDEACEFILTGQAPIAPPILGKIQRDVGERRTAAMITLEIDPAVSWKTVANAYRTLQQEVLGVDNRPIEERSADIFRFISEFRQADREVDWDAATTSWNAKVEQGGKPEWRYLKPKYLQHAYENIWDRLLRHGPEKPSDAFERVPGPFEVVTESGVRRSKWTYSPG